MDIKDAVRLANEAVERAEGRPLPDAVVHIEASETARYFFIKYGRSPASRVWGARDADMRKSG